MTDLTCCRSASKLWGPLGFPIDKTAIFAFSNLTAVDEAESDGKRKLLDWGEEGELCICGAGLANVSR